MHAFIAFGHSKPPLKPQQIIGNMGLHSSKGRQAEAAVVLLPQALAANEGSEQPQWSAMQLRSGVHSSMRSFR